MLVDEYQSDGHAAIAAGDPRSPAEFRAMVDEVLAEDGTNERYVSPQERELRTALGVR